MVNIDFQDKHTLVIGGSRGIGAAIVRKVAQAGSHVAWTFSGSGQGEIASQELAHSLGQYPVKHIFQAVNCTDGDATATLVNSLINEWGSLDCLVVNAGSSSPVPFLDLNLAEWKRMVDINLNSAFISLHTALPHLLKSKGSIVLIGSAAIIAGGGGRADYAAAKSGLEALNRAIAREFSPHGIRCNLVHPSLIETDLLKERHPDADKRAQLAQSVPLCRLGTPEEIANAVLFLLSDLASYITGQSLFVDGGRTFCK